MKLIVYVMFITLLPGINCNLIPKQAQHPNLRADYFPWRMGGVSDEAWQPDQ